MPVYLPVSLSLCLPVCLSVCLSSSIVLLNPLHTRHAMYERSASSSSRPVRKRRNVSLIIYIYYYYLSHSLSWSVPFFMHYEFQLDTETKKIAERVATAIHLGAQSKSKAWVRCEQKEKERQDQTRKIYWPLSCSIPPMQKNTCM